MADQSDTIELYKAPRADLTREPEDGYDETHPLSPKGRLGRVRYLGYSMVISFIAMIAIFAIGGIASVIGGGSGSTVLTVLGIIVYLVMLPCSFILMIKRFHDMNRTGWLSLALIVPVVNIVLGLMLLFVPGTKGTNSYGPQPRPPGRWSGVVIGAFFLFFVLGILAAIAIPAYQSYVKAAQSAREQQQVEKP